MAAGFAGSGNPLTGRDFVAGGKDFPPAMVAALVDAAITIVIPILHRLSRDELSGEAGLGTTKAANPIIAEIDAEFACLRARLAELERMKLQA